MGREVKTASERVRITEAAGLVSGLTLVSRVLGLVREGRPGAFLLANRVLTLLALLLGALVVMGVVFADSIVGLLAPGYDDVPGKADLTVLLTRVMMPFLPLVAFAAAAMGMLNAEERFAAYLMALKEQGLARD